MSNRIHIIIWLVSLLLSGLLLAGIFLAPCLHKSHPAWSAFLYQLFSSVCHQRPERSFFILSQPLAVCSRCLGFYSGFFFSLLFYPWLPARLINSLEKRPAIILISAGPLTLDALGGLLDLWKTPAEMRMVTGFIWAAFLPVFWLKALRELNSGKKVDPAC